ncbi:hypothetical protein [Burkholderia contaminans]|uniref:hypothetical protein n=1 Tax=Burkholderia contaminans TaxID=488447 RepID=UPI00211CD4FE|nr:hypothetical protein [Burkholderia contaminans]
MSVDIVVATGGNIVLTDPQAHSQSFYYGGVGIGYGWGAKIPKIKLPKFTIPELKLPSFGSHDASAAGSTYDFPSHGTVYMTSAFKGSELTRSDLQGGTVYLDGYGGAGVARGGAVMLLGINPALLALGLTSPAMSMILGEAIADAPALLFMHGLTAGFQAGFGGGILAGYLH